MKRSLLTLFATAAVSLLATPAQAVAGAFFPSVLYHIARARVTTNWNYAYAGTDDGLPFSSSGGETTNLSMSATDRSYDAFGIYTARLKGTAVGSYYFNTAGKNIDCPRYTFDPAAVQEQVELNLISLPGHRVEINAGLGPGQTRAATATLQREILAVGTTCGDLPTGVGYGLTYAPAPNNVHTPQCATIADGCAVVDARAFRSASLTIHIAVTGYPLPAGFTVIPSGASGHDLFSWDITVVLDRAHLGR